MLRTLVGGAAALLAICVLVGCGGRDLPDLAAASGVVTMNGSPLEDARITFIPIEPSASFSHGVTDAQGKFELSTFGEKDGALIGKHKVTISKVDMPDTKVDVDKLMKEGYGAGSMPGYGSAMGVGGKADEVKQEVPAKYSNKETTELEEEVTADGPNEFTFSLESK